MACGDRFAHLLVTPIGGYTPTNPYGKVAVPDDVQDWHQLASSLAARAFSEVARVKRAEDAEGIEDGQAQSIFERAQALEAMVDEAPTGAAAAWTAYLGGLIGGGVAMWDSAEGVAKNMAAAREATCVLELAAIRLEQLGEKVDLPASGVPSGGNGSGKFGDGKLQLGGWLVAAALGFGLYVVVAKGGD